MGLGRTEKGGATLWRIEKEQWGQAGDLSMDLCNFEGETKVWVHGERLRKGRSRKDLMWRVIAERRAVPADTDRLSESLSSLRDFAAGLGDSRR